MFANEPQVRREVGEPDIRHPSLPDHDAAHHAGAPSQLLAPLASGQVRRVEMKSS